MCMMDYTNIKLGNKNFKIFVLGSMTEARLSYIIGAYIFYYPFSGIVGETTEMLTKSMKFICSNIKEIEKTKLLITD